MANLAIVMKNPEPNREQSYPRMYKPERKALKVALNLIALAVTAALLPNAAVAQSDSAIAVRRARLCANHPTVCGAPAGTPGPPDGNSSRFRDRFLRMRPALKKALKKAAPQIVQNGVVMVMPSPVRNAFYQAELRAEMRKATAQIQAGQPMGVAGQSVAPIAPTFAGGPQDLASTPWSTGSRRPSTSPSASGPASTRRPCVRSTRVRADVPRSWRRPASRCATSARS